MKRRFRWCPHNLALEPALDINLITISDICKSVEGHWLLSAEAFQNKSKWHVVFWYQTECQFLLPTDVLGLFRRVYHNRKDQGTLHQEHVISSAGHDGVATKHLGVDRFSSGTRYLLNVSVVPVVLLSTINHIPGHPTLQYFQIPCKRLFANHLTTGCNTV
jgi:hypothetical protein